MVTASDTSSPHTSESTTWRGEPRGDNEHFQEKFVPAVAAEKQKRPEELQGGSASGRSRHPPSHQTRLPQPPGQEGTGSPVPHRGHAGRAPGPPSPQPPGSPHRGRS